MPFLDDTGIKTEVDRGPLWSAFTTFASQIERLVLVNLVWAVQLVPGLLGLGFYQLPIAVRLVLLAYTIIALPPATAALYGVLAEVVNDEFLNRELVGDQLRKYWRPGYKILTPLIGSLGFLLWLSISLSGMTVLTASAQLVLMLELVCANYWGALLVRHPKASALNILRQSMQLVWRYPAQALLLSGVVLLAFVLGALSIGGLFLAVPVVIALLQLNMCRTLKGT